MSTPTWIVLWLAKNGLKYLRGTARCITLVTGEVVWVDTEGAATFQEA